MSNQAELRQGSFEVAPMGIIELTMANLESMKKQAEEITVDLKTGQGYQDVRSMHIKAKELDLKVRNRLKELNDPLNEQRIKNNETAKKAQGMIAPIIEALGKKRIGWEALIIERKAEAERKEQDRVNGIRAKISAIQGVTVGLNSLDSRQLNVLAEEINTLELSEHEYQEFLNEAKAAASQTLGQILCAFEARIKFETEESDRKAESERLRIQKEEQEAEAKRLEAIRLENERKDREVREKIEAETRKLEEEKAALERAKQAEIDRVEREQREREIAEQARIDALKEAEEKAALEKAEAEAMKKAEAEEAARLEALKPDIAKLEEWKNMILSIELPDIKDPAILGKAKAVLEKIYAIAQTI